MTGGQTYKNDFATGQRTTFPKRQPTVQSKKQMKNLLIILISISVLLGCSDSKQCESVNSENEKMQIEHDNVKEINTNNSAMINRLQFSIDIKAEKEKIWKALWDDTHYRDWSGVFGEGSHYVVDNWKEGSKIMFLASDQSGIYSIIERHVPNKTIQFKHIGNVVNGKEQLIDEEAKKWSGATETYSLKEGSGFFTLLVEIDILDEHLEFMSTKFPIALEKIKKNSR